MKSKRTKALSITPKVKKTVYERDGGRCVLCGSPHGLPEAHYIPRSRGGLGIPENIVTLCRNCHRELDQTTRTFRTTTEFIKNRRIYQNEQSYFDRQPRA